MMQPPKVALKELFCLIDLVSTLSIFLPLAELIFFSNNPNNTQISL